MSDDPAWPERIVAWYGLHQSSIDGLERAEVGWKHMGVVAHPCFRGFDGLLGLARASLLEPEELDRLLERAL